MSSQLNDEGFCKQAETAGENVYLKEWWRSMNELETFGWLVNGGVHMDLPPVRSRLCDIEICV